MANKITGTQILVGLIVLVAVLYFAGVFKPTSSGGSGGTTIITSPANLTINAYDALQPGAAVTLVTKNTSTNGGKYASAGSSVAQGDKLDLIASATSYHTAWVSGLTVPQSTVFVVDVPMYADATASLQLFNTLGQAMTSGITGAGPNQTATSGGAYNFKVQVQGQDKKSTQDMRCILETTSAANTTSIVFTGISSGFSVVPSPKGNSKPNWYSANNSNSGVYVFDTTPVTGAGVAEGNIYFASQTGKSMTKGQLIVNCSTKEHFIDPYTGVHVYDVEDSQGNYKSDSYYSFNGQFN